MVVIGGGVIGLELGFVYVCFGFEIEVVEFVLFIFFIMDFLLGKEFIKIFKKEGFKFNFEISVSKVENIGNGVKIVVINKKKEEIIIEVDYCFVVVGCKVYMEGFGLDKIGFVVNNCG